MTPPSVAFCIVLVVALVVSALITVMSVRLIRAAIGLAVTSVILTVIMFQLNSPLAAVFELSVCAGLIPAIFISTIGLTGRTAPEDVAALRRAKVKKYWLLPILLIIAAIALTRVVLPTITPASINAGDVKVVFWSRGLDLIGQVAVLLGGALGVVVLVKESNKNEA